LAITVFQLKQPSPFAPDALTDVDHIPSSSILQEQIIRVASAWYPKPAIQRHCERQSSATAALSPAVVCTADTDAGMLHCTGRILHRYYTHSRYMKICVSYKTSVQVTLLSLLGACTLVRRKEGRVNQHVWLLLSGPERKAFVCFPLLESHLPLTTQDFWQIKTYRT